jgi:hypothetical protein
MSPNPEFRILRRCAAFLANLLAAFLGTAVLESFVIPLLKLFAHSAASTVIREWICSITLSALIGVSVERRRKTQTARWVWVAGVLWFAFGLTQVRNRWFNFSGTGCAEMRGMPCTYF